MAVNFLSLATLGFIGSTASVTDIAGLDFVVNNLTSTTAELKITSIPTGTATAKIGYRILKFNNSDDFVFTNEFTPAIGDIITITNLTEEEIYQMAGFSYDSEGSRSEPGVIQNVRPSAGYTHAREIAEAIKDILESSYNTEIATIALRDNEPYDTIELITDAQVGRSVLYPYISIYAQDTALISKYGTRKQWEYIFVIEVVQRSKTGDSRQLERDIIAYMEAAENVIDDNEVIGGTVWEAVVEGKSYSKVLQDQVGHLVQMGELLIRVRQTN